MRLLVAFSVFLLGAGPAMAQDAPGNPVAGKRVAQASCSQCHVIVPPKKAGDKRPPGAPPDFIVIAHNPEMTEEKLRNYLRFPHGRMDNVLLTRKDTANVISYIQSMSTITPGA